MSELAQSRQFCDVCHRSAHPPAADVLLAIDMEALVAAPQSAVQMIDTCACINMGLASRRRESSTWAVRVVD